MTGSLQTARLNSLGGHTDIATYRLNRPRGGGATTDTHTGTHTDGHCHRPRGQFSEEERRRKIMLPSLSSYR